VHGAASADTRISSIDRSFLLATAKDDGPSRMKGIQQRLGVGRAVSFTIVDP
jgi:hypothetical protein